MAWWSPVFKPDFYISSIFTFHTSIRLDLEYSNFQNQTIFGHNVIKYLTCTDKMKNIVKMLNNLMILDKCYSEAPTRGVL